MIDITVEQAVKELYPTLRRRVEGHWRRVRAFQYDDDGYAASSFPSDPGLLGRGKSTERRIFRQVLNPLYPRGFGRAATRAAIRAYNALRAEEEERWLKATSKTFCG